MNLTKRQHDTMECFAVSAVVSGLTLLQRRGCFSPIHHAGKVVGGAEGHVQVPRLGDDQVRIKPSPTSSNASMLAPGRLLSSSQSPPFQEPSQNTLPVSPGGR